MITRYERLTIKAMLNVYAGYFPLLDDRRAQRRQAKKLIRAKWRVNHMGYRPWVSGPYVLAQHGFGRGRV